MREHQRNRLRMFVMDELRELLRVCFLKHIEAGHLAGNLVSDLIQQTRGRFGAERALQHLPRVVDSAFHDILLRDHHLVELFENGFGLR